MRLISKEEFGLIAKVTALTGIASLISDLGLSLATIQSKEITHKELSVFFWLNLAVSTTLGILIAGASPLFGWFYADPRVIPIGIAIAFNILRSLVWKINIMQF